MCKGSTVFNIFDINAKLDWRLHIYCLLLFMVWNIQIFDIIY